MDSAAPKRKPRVCAVSYLNTTPLVYGFIEGPQKGSVDLSFAVPSICAERSASRVVDIGLNPVIEVATQGFAWLPGTGIACRGTVRSILLVSRKPFDEVRTLAADIGSRTSVQLARIVLQRKYNVEPALLPMAPDLPNMLAQADAALLIGDNALRVEPTDLNHICLDLGEEWQELTGLPMVFAVWSGHKDVCRPDMDKLFRASAEYGVSHIERIIERESEQRGLPEWLVRAYLTRSVHFLLDEADRRGLWTFLRHAGELQPALLAERR